MIVGEPENGQSANHFSPLSTREIGEESREVGLICLCYHPAVFEVVLSSAIRVT